MGMADRCRAQAAQRMLQVQSTLGTLSQQNASKCIQILAAQVRYAIRATREGMD